MMNSGAWVSARMPRLMRRLSSALEPSVRRFSVPVAVEGVRRNPDDQGNDFVPQPER